MKLKLMKLALCRTPALAIEDTLEKKWQELKNLIADSSPSFYDIIAPINNPELTTIKEKTAYTIWKYFNRSRYRATPYNGFAAFSVMALPSNGGLPITISQKIRLHRFIDWGKSASIATSAIADNADIDYFLTNSTIYKLGDEIRYIRQKNGQFEMAAVKVFAELQTILSLCRSQTSREEIYKVMKSDYNMSAKFVDDLLDQLLRLQLLMTNSFPNITGQDYFDRLKIKDSGQANTYSISEREVISGGIDNHNLTSVPDAITFLASHLPNTGNPVLNEFRNAFAKKFEYQWVPLSLAIDPETGVGYGNMIQQPTGHEVINQMDIANRKVQKEAEIRYTKLHRFLLNQFMKGGIVRMEEFEGTKSNDTLAIANTISVLLRFWQGHPVIETAGGCTANAFLGRFTLASSELETFGREVAAIETRANPDVLFFDIAYQGEKAVDNVNRRKHLYDYELPVLIWSTFKTPLCFDDILVAVRGQEVILWSKKHNKRMIPRIPSAYNYTRSDLAVYRFLCDLQHQHIKSDLNFRIKDFFPGLKYYPRIVYRDTILSPAMWQVPKGLIITDKMNTPDEQRIKVTHWLKKAGITMMFKTGHADQTLTFDPGIPADISAFLLYYRQHLHEEIYLSEALTPDRGEVKSEEGNSYAAQFLMNYYHEHPVYTKVSGPSTPLVPSLISKDVVFPGESWLYVEIYCHPSRSNNLLVNAIPRYIKKAGNQIKKWFFIRYNDPAPHIRLRMEMREASNGYQVLGILNDFLKYELSTRLISDIQVKTYFRETARYGADRMDLAEVIFHHDSIYVLRLLAKVKIDENLYSATLKFMHRIVVSCLCNHHEQVSFVKQMANNFSLELNLNPDIFKKLNRYYQDIKKDIYGYSDSTLIKQLRAQEARILQILCYCQTVSEREKMMADLIHMHINRLFDVDQRTHEAVLYLYLLKMIKEAHHALPTSLPECSIAG